MPLALLALWCWRFQCCLGSAAGPATLPGHAARSSQILLEVRLALPAKDLPKASSVPNSRGRTSQSMIPKASAGFGTLGTCVRQPFGASAAFWVALLCWCSYLHFGLQESAPHGCLSRPAQVVRLPRSKHLSAAVRESGGQGILSSVWQTTKANSRVWGFESLRGSRTSGLTGLVLPSNDTTVICCTPGVGQLATTRHRLA